MPPVHAPSPRRWRFVRWLLLGLAFLLLLAGAIAYEALPYAIIVSGRLERTVKYHGRTPADLGLIGERFDVEVEPGLWLRGWLIRTAGTTRGTVVLLHGHGSCKESTFPLAKLLSENGYQSLTYDSRGHGESGGRYCTFGYYEHGDCSRYLDEAERRFGPLGPLAIYGQSLGGAVALQTLAEDRRFRCGVVESTFATLREVVNSDARNLFGLSSPTIIGSALARAGEIAHFPALTLSPEESAEKIRCPVLIIHGTADERIPVGNGERIFHHLQTPGCAWYPVEGAGHGGVWRDGGATYEHRVLDFLALNEH